MEYFDKRYAEICSERTLQSDKQGFFLDFTNNLIETVGKNWVQKSFGRYKTDKERIRAIYEDNNVKEYVIEFFSRVEEVYRNKNNEVATKCLREAQNCFKEGNKLKSLTLYSQAILKAPAAGPESVLALCFMGRSKVLVTQNEYAAALIDLQLAFKTNLAAKLKGEAFAMQAICYKNLNDHNKATVAFGLAEKLLTDTNQMNELRKEFEGDSKQIIKNVTKKVPEIDGAIHPKLKNISAKIIIKESSHLGRYAVANEQIKTGEVLVVEPPYVACLLPKKFGTHCHHCFERLLAPVGCPNCSGVAFCSTECQNIAIITYHKYECKFLDLLIGSGMSILSHAALRMITQNTLEKNREIYKNRTKIPVYKLCTNSNRRDSEDFFRRTIMAGFLLRCLQKSNYFNRNQTVMPNDVEFMIGELLLFHLQILQFNAHEIYETLHSKEHRFKGSIVSYIGVGLYPSVALFNHGCYLGVTRYFSGRNIVISSVRPIEPGQMIEENYGPMFTWRNLAERQKTLTARYWFKCECKACKEDWPTLQNLESAPERIRCTNRKCSYTFTLPVSAMQVKCPLCQKDIDLSENIAILQLCKQQYQNGIQLLEEQQPNLAIEIVCPALDDFHKVSTPPHKPTHLVQETLRLCLADSGNTFECPQNQTQ